MRRLALTLAALLALAPAAPAQDGAPPPAAEDGAPAAPARHENVVTEAAKAAFEAMEKLMYSPVANGLKDLTGTMEMKMDMGGMGGAESPGMPSMGMSFDLNFQAPRKFTIGAQGGEMFGPQGADGMKRAVEQIVLNGMGIVVPLDDKEFDADLLTVEGKRVLVITSYEEGVRRGEMRMTLADNFLPVSGAMSFQQEMFPGAEPVEQKGKVTWTFAKDGDLHRLEKMVVEVPMAPAPIEYRVSYSEAEGFRLPTKFVMDMGGMKFGFRFTELTVNGKKVELPEERKPTIKIPPLPGRKPAGGGAEEGGAEEGGTEEGGGR